MITYEYTTWGSGVPSVTSCSVHVKGVKLDKLQEKIETAVKKMMLELNIREGERV